MSGFEGEHGARTITLLDALHDYCARFHFTRSATRVDRFTDLGVLVLPARELCARFAEDVGHVDLIHPLLGHHENGFAVVSIGDRGQRTLDGQPGPFDMTPDEESTQLSQP